MNVDDLRVFLTVAQTQSMTQAGLRLGLAKSVVSRRLGDLEHHLGVRLFTRSTRTMSLTQDGVLLQARAQELVDSLDVLKELFKGSARRLAGPLRITAPTSLGHRRLGAVLFDFAHRHPDIALRVELSDRTVDLVGEGYDLAVRVGPPSSAEVVARRLCASHRVIVASPTLLERLGPPTSLEDLEARWPAVAYSNRSLQKEWQVQTPAGRRSVQPAVRLCADSGALALDAAVHGLGLTMAPTFLAAEAIVAGALRVVQLPGVMPVPDDILVVRQAQRHPPLRVRALVDHLVEAFDGTPPWDLAIRDAGVADAAVVADAEQCVREARLLRSEGDRDIEGRGAAVVCHLAPPITVATADP